MTEQLTAPVDKQLPAAMLLAEMMRLHPQLPSAYITLHRPYEDMPVQLDLNLGTPTAFEQWRNALAIEPNDVQLHPYGRDSWVTVVTLRSGVLVHLSAHGILLTDDQLTAPRIIDAAEATA